MIAILQWIWRLTDVRMAHRWRRHVPFADLIVDQWTRAKAYGFGANVSVYDSSLVLGDVKVGAHTWIGPFTVLDGSGGGLTIGHHCSISAGVHIYTHDSVEWALSGGVAPYPTAPTRIGDRCYIGPHAVIAKGVTIGDGCTIGAHALVTADVPAGMTAVGCPARILRPAARGPVPVDHANDDFATVHFGTAVDHSA